MKKRGDQFTPPVTRTAKTCKRMVGDLAFLPLLSGFEDRFNLLDQFH
jgi:hypothetical protein